jgi:hypothetical protein
MQNPAQLQIVLLLPAFSFWVGCLMKLANLLHADHPSCVIAVADTADAVAAAGKASESA